MHNSIWHIQRKLPSFPALSEDLKTEVLIIGGGIAGLLCAWKLKQEGVPYALVETEEICGGITGNTTAKLTVHHGLIYEKLLRTYGPERAKQYYLSNKQALADISELAKTMDCDFLPQSNYLYARFSPAELEGEMAALRQLDIPFSYQENLALPFPTAGAIRMEHQAQFHPLKFLAQIAGGLHIYEHTRAISYGDGQVVTDRGTIQASKIIVATHFPLWNRHGGYFLKMYQDRSYVIALKDAQQPEGMYLDASGKGFSFRSQGPYLLLGGGSYRTGKEGRGWEPLYTLAKQHYPQAEMVAHWAAQDCITLDGIPYIGQYGKHTPNVYVATGFQKWGMTTSMVAANLLTDLVMGRKNAACACFSPQRRSLHLQLAANALEAAANLLRPTVPRCPHLGCSLRWNPQEHTWDCPCHGSRFTKDGVLLDGPATGDLPKKPKKTYQ